MTGDLSGDQPRDGKTIRHFYAAATQHALLFGGPMDLWFVGLIIALVLLTWGLAVVCDRLMGRP